MADEDPFHKQTVTPPTLPAKTPAEWSSTEREAAAARQAALESFDAHKDPHKIPPGFIPRGTSILRDGDGNVLLSWEKTKIDEHARYQAVLDSFAGMRDSIVPLDPIPAPISHQLSDLMCVYPMGDPHLGMYAWQTETLDRSFDVVIAERELCRAVDLLVGLAPPAHTAVVISLGDFFHSDNSDNRTRRSHNALDVDGRYAKIARTGVSTMVRIVMRALEKHANVIVRCEIGNHDDESSLWLALCLEQRFMDNPRVTIDTSPAKFWYHRFGRVLIATTHGDTVKRTGPALSEIMAHDQPQSWGETRHRHWYVGHVHHESVHERPGVTIETFRTLAPRDAWAAGAGYRSAQDMRMDVFHSQHGRINRHIVGIGMVQPQ